MSISSPAERSGERGSQGPVPNLIGEIIRIPRSGIHSIDVITNSGSPKTIVIIRGGTQQDFFDPKHHLSTTPVEMTIPSLNRNPELVVRATRSTGRLNSEVLKALGISEEWEILHFPISKQAQAEARRRYEVYF